MPTAAYDEIADWYAAWVDGAVSDYSSRVESLLQKLLGRPTSLGTLSLDIACGTGKRAQTIKDLGWRVVGIDLSRGQLRHAMGLMPVAAADATALPIGSGRLDAVTCILCHTDVPDYAAVMAEAARVLKPGGRFVHIGIHPAFTGAFADRSDPARIIVDSSYERRDLRFDSFTPHGVRAKVGAWHTPLAALLQACIDAGLSLTRVAEVAPEGAVPDIFAFTATKL